MALAALKCSVQRIIALPATGPRSAEPTAPTEFAPLVRPRPSCTSYKNRADFRPRASGRPKVPADPRLPVCERARPLCEAIQGVTRPPNRAYTPDRPSGDPHQHPVQAIESNARGGKNLRARPSSATPPGSTPAWPLEIGRARRRVSDWHTQYHSGNPCGDARPPPKGLEGPLMCNAEIPNCPHLPVSGLVFSLSVRMLCDL